MGQVCLSKEIVLSNLAENIKTARKNQNISQEELAFRINSARNFVGCIERAEKSPTIYTLYKISNALELSLSEILENVDRT
ncbi:MAG: helix-turn-helix transcriptional regulator [Candidatus Gastranaerophilales bacterium]